MRIGLFGGSFDPIHRGHVEPIREACAALDLDRVLYLPTADPPHKEALRAPAWARFSMVELALLDEEGLYASDHELTPGRTAYTVDTVTYFQESRPADTFLLLVGADSFAALHTWRRWRHLAGRVEIGVLARPGWDPAALPAETPAELRALAGSSRVHRVPNRPPDVSSTALRAAFARGEDPPPGSLDPLVVRYIHKYALYR